MPTPVVVQSNTTGQDGQLPLLELWEEKKPACMQIPCVLYMKLLILIRLQCDAASISLAFPAIHLHALTKVCQHSCRNLLLRDWPSLQNKWLAGKWCRLWIGNPHLAFGHPLPQGEGRGRGTRIKFF